ncbi:LD-carboxypeptidase [soil metagenome]
MTLLIDPSDVAGHGRLWSHLASDESFAELHRFASSLGIPRRGFDRDHYDVPAERYDDVVAAGVRPVSSRELIDRLTDNGLRRRKGGARSPHRAGATLLRPERLSPGSRVVVVAPAGPVLPGRLEEGLAVLSGWGLDVQVGAHVRGVHPSVGYLAAPDQDRAADFQAAWCDPQVQAVICARGGYGGHRMVDLLDWDAIAAAGPKVLVGFSDVTALHQAFARRLGWATVHGPVVTSLGVGDDPSREHLRRVLFDPERALTLTPDPVDVLVGGRAEGVLVGGNLALLAATLGTTDVMSAAGSIAVLEDVAEETYELDRLVTQLMRSGWFVGCRGVVLGDFTGGGDASAVLSMFAERLGPLGVPVLAGAPIGHVERNLSVPLGVPVVLEAPSQGAGTLTLRLPALA